MREPSIEATLYRVETRKEVFWRWEFELEGEVIVGTKPYRWQAKRAAKKAYRKLLDEHSVPFFSEKQRVRIGA